MAKGYAGVNCAWVAVAYPVVNFAGIGVYQAEFFRFKLSAYDGRGNKFQKGLPGYHVERCKGVECKAFFFFYRGKMLVRLIFYALFKGGKCLWAKFFPFVRPALG